MRIKEVNIVNFKGFQNETVTFNGNLTVHRKQHGR